MASTTAQQLIYGQFVTAQTTNMRTIKLGGNGRQGNGPTALSLTWGVPTAARSLTIPDPGGDDTFTMNNAVQTLTNKTISGAILTGVVKLDNGTAAAPSLTFASDTDTGLYRIGANNIGIAANGAKVLDIGTAGLGVVGTLTLLTNNNFLKGTDEAGNPRNLAGIDSSGFVVFGSSARQNKFGSDILGSVDGNNDFGSNGANRFRDIWISRNFNAAGTVTSGGALTVTAGGATITAGNVLLSAGTLTVTSNAAAALSVGPSGATNPIWQINAATGSAVAGLLLTGAVTGGTVALIATDSGSNTSLSINGKGTGTLSLGTATNQTVNITAAGGSLGFYGHTATALQTGVAVTAAGIHAALVALGLITA